jgi:hypothetical protein
MESNGGGRLASQLDQLLRCIVPGCTPEKHRDLLQFAAQIAGSAYQGGAGIDFPKSQSGVLRELRSALARQGKYPATQDEGARRDEARLDELAERVLKSASLHKAQESLTLLMHLAGSGNEQQQGGASLFAQHTAAAAAADPARFVTPRSLNGAAASGEAMNRHVVGSRYDTHTHTHSSLAYSLPPSVYRSLTPAPHPHISC